MRPGDLTLEDALVLAVSYVERGCAWAVLFAFDALIGLCLGRKAYRDARLCSASELREIFPW